MATTADYQKTLNKEKTTVLRNLQNDLPEFCRLFFRGIESNTSILTRINYAYDLRLFFTFLSEKIPEFIEIQYSDFDIKKLEVINRIHIDMFLEHLNYYKNDELERENHERGKARKLSSLRSFFKYYFKSELISKNVVELVDMPKLKEKPIIKLEADEVVKLIKSVESGCNLSPTQMKYHKFTKKRDIAILVLLLGTGMRISELIGIDINDIDLGVNGIKITRKGGNKSIIYFSDEVRFHLESYLEQRREIQALPDHENALLLSLQRRRISVRSLQNLVKKYTKDIAPLKNISPHKLRSTYGTMLYQETGDIYLVADVLGHKDVNTTRRHYASINDERKRRAASIVKLEDK